MDNKKGKTNNLNNHIPCRNKGFYFEDYETPKYENKSTNFEMIDIEGIAVEVKKSSGQKCHRCWKFNNDLNSKNICNRCEDAINK